MVALSATIPFNIVNYCIPIGYTYKPYKPSTVLLL